MLVPVLFVLGAGVATLLSRKKWAGRVVAMTFVGLNLVSDMNLRFSERHAKDDYRTAAAIAVAAVTRGERVWWCADPGAGFYYGVPLIRRDFPHDHAKFLAEAHYGVPLVRGDSAPAPDGVWWVMNPAEHVLDSQPPPQLVVLSSKMGAWDQENRVRTYLEQNHYSLSQVLSAFTIWRR
jgi:hypothetical protein